MTGPTSLCLFLALIITYGSISFGQIDPDQGTGIEGVIHVSPLVPDLLEPDPIFPMRRRYQTQFSPLGTKKASSLHRSPQIARVGSGFR